MYIFLWFQSMPCLEVVAGVTWNETEGVREGLGTVIEEFPPLKIFFQL